MSIELEDNFDMISSVISWLIHKGIKYLNPLPIYTTKGTWDAPNVVDIEPYKPFKINNLKVFAS